MNGLRHQIFACSALSQDDHRGTTACHQPGDGVDPLHHLGIANHAGQAGFDLRDLALGATRRRRDRLQHAPPRSNSSTACSASGLGEDERNSGWPVCEFTVTTCICG